MANYTLQAPKAGETIHNYSNVVFTLTLEPANGKYPPSVSVPEVDEVHMTWKVKGTGETKTGIRQIRYSIGETSIFVDEQSDRAEANRGIIEFIDGALVVNEKESTKMEYLEICNFNEKNRETAMPGTSVIFRANDAAYKSQRNLEEEQRITKLSQLIYNMEDLEAEGLGLSLGLPYQKGVHSIAELKSRFIAEIKKDAITFERNLKSDTRRHKLILIKAIEKNFISLDKETNTIYNEVGGKTKIIDCPDYVDALDFFVELSLTRDDYKQAYAEIKKLVDNKGKKTPKSREWEQWDEKTLLDEAIKAKIIKNSFGTFSLVNHGTLAEDAKNIKKGTGYEVAVLYLRDNKEVKDKVVNMLESWKKDQENK